MPQNKKETRAAKLASGSTAKATADHLQPIDDPKRLDAVMDAIQNIEITQTQAFTDLDILSGQTFVEEIEAVPEGLFQVGDKFKAAATVYVSLNYGDKDDGFTTSEAFPAQAEGHFEKKGTKIEAKIDTFEVDTSSFYE